MSKKNKVCMELVFSKTTSDSEATKVREFWKFIDSQNEIKPYVVQNYLKNHKTSEKEDEMLDCSSTEGNNVEDLENSSNCVCQNNKSFWYDELRLFKTLGLDKLALASCKRTELGTSRKESENLILSDMVDQPYKEVKADLRNFERRLKNKEPN